VLELYETQLKQLIDYGSERNIQIAHKNTLKSISQTLPTILERFRFIDGAESSSLFIREILAQYRRRQWDRQVMDLRFFGEIKNRNMLLLEELATNLVVGRNEREILAKRFIFRANGCLFVYTSSVPDEI